MDMMPIREAAKFFGREYLLLRFYSAIANRQSISLIGSRHSGKSSLLICACLAEIQERFEVDLSRHIFMLLDLRGYLHKTSNDFFHIVSEEIMRQGRKQAGLSLSLEGQGEDAFSKILEKVNEQEHFPVLLLDAFDNITLNPRFGPEFLAFLRSHATMKMVSYVTATLLPLNEVSHQEVIGSPFFNIFHSIKVGALTREEARELVSIPAVYARMPFTEEEIAWTLKMAGRHPFFIQRTCSILFEEKLLAPQGSVDLQRIRKMAYRDLKPHFVDSWEHLSEPERLSLQDVARQPQSHHEEVSELSSSLFFRQFVRNTCNLNIFHLTAEELESALDMLYDLNKLGNTNLRHMKAVSWRLSESDVASSSLVERGLAIRQVLNEAHEHLQGSEMRKDSAPEWRMYNILDYRFFHKHRLTNEQVAARLEITSIRKYYRERSKAIEALLDVLFEMEKSIDFDE